MLAPPKYLRASPPILCQSAAEGGRTALALGPDARQLRRNSSPAVRINEGKRHDRRSGRDRIARQRRRMDFSLRSPVPEKQGRENERSPDEQLTGERPECRRSQRDP